jgi:hypothetical protein
VLVYIYERDGLGATGGNVLTLNPGSGNDNLWVANQCITATCQGNRQFFFQVGVVSADRSNFTIWYAAMPYQAQALSSKP